MRIEERRGEEMRISERRAPRTRESKIGGGEKGGGEEAMLCLFSRSHPVGQILGPSAF